LGRVISLAGQPVSAADVAVYLDTMATPVQQLSSSFQGEFEISLAVNSKEHHRLRLVATKKEYHPATESVDLTFEGKTEVIDLVLRDTQPDLDQLSLESLTSSIAERLRLPAGTSAIAPQGSEVVRRVEALLDAEDPDGALRLLDAAVGRDPNSVELRTLQGLAMFEAGSWSGGTRQLNETAALNESRQAGKRRSEPDLILGVLECWRGNPQKALERFLRALDAEPNGALLLEELGRAYLLSENWSGADASLTRALQAGASPEAHLLRAQALLAQAKLSDAQTECQTYLGGRKPKDLPTPVRMLWTKVNKRMELETESEEGAQKSVVRQTAAERLQTVPELNGLEPATTQEELAPILQKTGERVEAFFQDFHNTSSREEIREETLHRNGKVGSSLQQNFQYLLLAWPDKSRPTLEEYRTGGREPNPGEGVMLTKGFASAAQFLLPAYQPEATFVYLGRQRVEGRETHVMAFAQRPEIARLMIGFSSGKTHFWALSQGVIWIDCDTYQIIRLRTDLLSPLVSARLQRETTEIHYSEVHFPGVPFSYWLPREVVVTVDWQGKLRQNRHNYSDFRLFNVQSRIITSPEPGEKP
jgi:tetratricopeptide (TPR) repeat protein